jgi:hypothetical protein
VSELARASVTVKDATEAAYGLRSVLDGTSHRSAAQRLQREIMAMPSPDEFVPVLEELAN